MTIPSDGTQSEKPPTFERIEEYKAVLEFIGRLSARRQNSNDVFVGINTVFLTGLGVFLATHPLSWGTTVSVTIIAVAVTPVNFVWRMALMRYDGNIGRRVKYLLGIEEEFRERRGDTRDKQPVGLFLQNKESEIYSNTHLELALAMYFVLL